MELGWGLVAVHFEHGVQAVPFVGVCYAEFLGYAGVEAEYEPVQHVVLVIYWTDYFAVKTVGSLAEWVSVGYKVLVWRSSDQAADLTD